MRGAVAVALALVPAVAGARPAGERHDDRHGISISPSVTSSGNGSSGVSLSIGGTS